MLNSCNFTGRLTSDPKFYENDNNVKAAFTLAVSADRKGADGEYETDFLDFVSWNGSAQFVQKWLHKGDQITVANARAQVRRYTDGDGKERRRVEFVTDKIYFGVMKRRDAEDSLSDNFD